MTTLRTGLPDTRSSAPTVEGGGGVDEFFSTPLLSGQELWGTQFTAVLEYGDFFLRCNLTAVPHKITRLRMRCLLLPCPHTYLCLVA